MPIKLLRSACLALLTAASACSPRNEPELPPQTYREAVTAFYVGLSAMQTTQEVLAKERFERAAALVPQEPAGWANLGLLLLRQQDLDQGAQHLARAASLAPDSAAIQRLQALAESRRGNLAASDRALAAGASSSTLATGARRTRWRSRPSGRAARANDAEAQRFSNSCSPAATIWPRASSTCASPPSAATPRRCPGASRRSTDRPRRGRRPRRIN